MWSVDGAALPPDVTGTRFPKMVRMRQTFERPQVDNIAATVAEQVSACGLGERVHAGESVAITAGSRGIANMAEIVRALVDAVKDVGAKPFVFPAMGSHGGATAEGQAAVLHHYGITEATMGCPIRSGAEAVEVGRLGDGTPVYLDRYANDADHLVVVNRVKPHTGFHAAVESGLCKMLAIGVGKQVGASYYHRAFLRQDFEETILGAANFLIDSGRVAMGLAIVENGYDETAMLVGLAPDEIVTVEKKLIQQARDLMGSIPFREVDCLIVDYIGKDVSGAGMDSNITGRKFREGEGSSSVHAPEVLRIFVRDLTEKSQGNATGIGAADVTTRRVVEKIDRGATYMNALTAKVTAGCKIPPYFDTDAVALAWVLNTVGLTEPEDTKVVRIRSTLDLEEMLVSEALIDEAASLVHATLLGDAEDMEFSDDGALREF
jgi:hypothetical protein